MTIKPWSNSCRTVKAFGTDGRTQRGWVHEYTRITDWLSSCERKIVRRCEKARANENKYLLNKHFQAWSTSVAYSILLDEFGKSVVKFRAKVAFNKLKSHGVIQFSKSNLSIEYIQKILINWIFYYKAKTFRKWSFLLKVKKMYRKSLRILETYIAGNKLAVNFGKWKETTWYIRAASFCNQNSLKGAFHTWKDKIPLSVYLKALDTEKKEIVLKQSWCRWKGSVEARRLKRLRKPWEQFVSAIRSSRREMSERSTKLKLTFIRICFAKLKRNYPKKKTTRQRKPCEYVRLNYRARETKNSIVLNRRKDENRRYREDSGKILENRVHDAFSLLDFEDAILETKREERQFSSKNTQVLTLRFSDTSKMREESRRVSTFWI